MKRSLILTRALFVMALIVCGLSAAIAAPARPEPKVTLTMWCSPYPQEAGWAIQMVSLWNRSHPDVQVRLQKIPGERVAEDILREAIRDHKTPDVCAHMFPVNVHEFVKMGGLMPLDTYGTLLSTSEKRSGSNAGFRSPDGKLYQIPWKCNPIMLQYNKGLLAKAGVAPPRTYSQFLAVADALHKRGVYAWAPNPSDKWYTRYYDFYPLYLAASGGKTFLDASGKPTFNDAAAVSVMDFLGKCFKRGYAPTKETFQDAPAQNEAFASGKLAFLVTGPWNAPLITELAGNTVQSGFEPLMVPDNADAKKPVYTYGNFRNISIFSSCKHPREAAQLVEFLISKQADLAFLQATSELPYRPALMSDPAFGAELKKHPYLVTFAKQLPYVRPVENTPHFNRILNAISKQFVESAVKGSKSPQQAVRDASDEVVRLVGGR